MSKELDKHFTATTYILGPKGILFLKHKKLDTWLPPGGHIEKNELPHETALREVKEETGLDVRIVTEAKHQDHKCFFTENDERAEIHPHPWKVLLEKIEDKHYHIDLIYLAEVKGSEELGGEEHRFKWFSKKELEETNLLFPNVKYLGMLALTELQTRIN